MNTVDYIGNANQRSLLLLVLDASSSMETVGPSGKTRIQALNEGLALLEKSLKDDDMAISRVQLAIVSVGGPNNDADVMMDWTDVVNFKAFPLRTGGSTPLGKGVQVGLDLLERGKANLRGAGINYYRPWMVIISDGEPTDPTPVWAAAIQKAKAAEQAKMVLIHTIGVDGSNFSKLCELSMKPPLILKSVNFHDLFVWLSKSVRTFDSQYLDDSLELPLAPSSRNLSNSNTCGRGIWDGVKL